MNTSVKSPIQFKGSLFTLTILRVNSHDLGEIQTYITNHILKAPQFFRHSPVVLDLTVLTEPFSLSQLIDILIKVELIPVGIVSDNPELIKAAIANRLALFPKSKLTSEIKPSVVQNKNKTASQHIPAKVHNQPIRSGQQIYAKDTDLIITSTVSHGAEVIADGNIHIYGTLHGRALAGVSGNTDSRIFCHKLDAEMISIAGLYQLSDDFESKKTDQPVQVFLKQDKLYIENL